MKPNRPAGLAMASRQVPLKLALASSAEMPLELGLIGAAFWFYLSRTRGPIGPSLILLGAMLTFQAINWFAPQPSQYSLSIPLLALFSYAVLIALARWVGTTRHHRRAAGLAMASYRR